MAHGGLRPECLGNYRGDEGLRVKDLPDATLVNGLLTFTKIPTRILVPAHLSKRQQAFFTFLGDEGCNYLAAAQNVGKRTRAAAPTSAAPRSAAPTKS